MTYLVFLFDVFETFSQLWSIFQCSSTPQITIDSLNSFQILFHWIQPMTLFPSWLKKEKRRCRSVQHQVWSCVERHWILFQYGLEFLEPHRFIINRLGSKLMNTTVGKPAESMLMEVMKAVSRTSLLWHGYSRSKDIQHWDRHCCREQAILPQPLSAELNHLYASPPGKLISF